MAAGIPVCETFWPKFLANRRDWQLAREIMARWQQGLRSYRLNLNSAHTCVGKPPVSIPLFLLLPVRELGQEHLPLFINSEASVSNR